MCLPLRAGRGGGIDLPALALQFKETAAKSTRLACDESCKAAVAWPYSDSVGLLGLGLTSCVLRARGSMVCPLLLNRPRILCTDEMKTICLKIGGFFSYSRPRHGFSHISTRSASLNSGNVLRMGFQVNGPVFVSYGKRVQAGFSACASQEQCCNDSSRVIAVLES